MWRDTPEQRLDTINQRNSDLIAEAASTRLARRAARDRRGFTGLRVRLGTLLIVVGRTLCEEDVLRHDPAHS
ncbi:MAG: hypothetical protein ACHQ01_00615 [Candidatus Limnocylindrales bacterium]